MAQWRAAADALQAHWPLCAPTLRGVGPWLRWQADPRPIPVLTVRDPFEARAALGPQGPWLALGLSEDPETGECALSLWGHHALFDARGLQAFARALCAAARGEPLPAWRHAAPLVRWRDLAHGAHREPPLDEAPLLGRAPTAERGVRTAWRSVEGPPRQVAARSALALAQIAQRHDPQRAKIRIGLPVDLRALDATATAVAPAPPQNLTGVAHLEVGADCDLAALSARLRSPQAAEWAFAQARAAETLRSLPLWLVRAGARTAWQRTVRGGRFGVSAVISNVGPYVPQRLSTEHFQAERLIWLPPESPASPLFLMISGTDERIHFSAAMPESLAEGGRLEALLEALCAPFEGDRGP